MFEPDEMILKSKRLSLFFSVVYCRRWLLCDQLFCAPENLLALYKEVFYKLDQHLSYLSSERIWLCFFFAQHQR